MKKYLAKKLNIFEKWELRRQFPKIKRKNSIINKDTIELLAMIILMMLSLMMIYILYLMLVYKW